MAKKKKGIGLVKIIEILIGLVVAVLAVRKIVTGPVKSLLKKKK